MLDKIYAGIAAVAYGIQTVGNAGKWMFNLNYQFVGAVGHYVSLCFALIAHYAGILRLVLVTIWSNVAGLFMEIYQFLQSVYSMVVKLAGLFYESGCEVYLNTYSACIAVSEFVMSSALLIKSTFVDMYNFFTTGVSSSITFAVAVISTFFCFVANIGAACVSFITAVWHSLGFVLSAVAYFPTFLTKTVEKAKERLIDIVSGVLMATTKETYLGIVVLCLIYLTLSNIMRFFSYQSFPLFSRRMRRRRHRAAGTNQWQFDRGFESDFEDMYSSDVDERDRQPTWLNDLNDGEAEHVSVDNSDDSRSNTSGSDNDVSENEDAADDAANDSDEYTVESENSGDDGEDDEDSSDADSINSLNSQTFSTGSSEHDIEVQLPPLDQHYSLRSRSSTPARQPGKSSLLSCPEDFNREMERERDKRKCVVCQDEIKCVLVMPCRHLCMCVACANQIVRSRIPGRRTCPLCRTRIEKVMNIYV